MQPLNMQQLNSVSQEEQHKTYRLLIACNVIAALVIWIAYAAVSTPDTLRFFGQASSLVEGNGYKTVGVPETFLPPGYPVFIAIVKYFGGNEFTVRALQICLALMSCNLVFFAIRPYSRRAAIVATFAMAIHPQAARLVGYLLSETFGLFLCSVLVFTFSRIEQGYRGFINYLLFGVVLIALPRTSPATIVLSVAIGGYVLYKLLIKRLPMHAVVMVIGVSSLLIPWQVHCINSTGSVCSTLYSSNVIQRLDNSPNVIYYWFRTWAHGERDLPVIWRSDVKAIPERAFRSEEEKIYILEAISEKNTQTNSTGHILLNESADKFVAQNRFLFYVGLPMIRSFNLWFDMMQIDHVQMEYVGRFFSKKIIEDYVEVGPIHTFQRILKSFASTFVYLIYISYPVFFLVITCYGLIKKEAIIILIGSSILAYTLISGFVAHGESRRNVVFLPAILYLLRFVPTARTCQMPLHSPVAVAASSRGQ